MIQMNLQNSRRVTDLDNKHVLAGREGIVKRVWDGHVFTAVFQIGN